ncbi:MAG: hypothetical protein IPM25_07785 [Chloracidobacterium sp.]|nr:hypothetical protein [Chloracidobacterium sp.]
MKIKLILAVLSVIALSVVAAAQDERDIDFVMNAKNRFKGRDYSYSVTSKDFERTPEWDPVKGEPPLSVSKALAVARNNMSLFLTDKRGWQPTSIRLTSTGHQRWYYFVTFSCVEPICADEDGVKGFNILVKLDGTIAVPKFSAPEPARRP